MSGLLPIGVLFLVLGSIACAIGYAILHHASSLQTAVASLGEIGGQSEEEILRALGNPQRIDTADGSATYTWTAPGYSFSVVMDKTTCTVTAHYSSTGSVVS